MHHADPNAGIPIIIIGLILGWAILKGKKGGKK